MHVMTKKRKVELADTTEFRREMRQFVNDLRDYLGMAPLYGADVAKNTYMQWAEDNKMSAVTAFSGKSILEDATRGNW